MLKIEDLRKTLTAILPDGEVIGSQTNFETFHRIFLSEKVNPEYVNLLTASSLMFTALDHVDEGLDALVEVLERKGMDELALAVVTLNASVVMAKSVAVEGLRAISKKFDTGA